MKVTFEGGKISLDLWDLLGQANDEDRATLIDALACQTEVIDEVVNQIIDGWTTLGSHGSTGYGGNAAALHGIDGARMRIAKASSEIAAREIERMAEAVKRVEAHSNDGWAAYHNLMASRRGEFA